MSKRRFETTKKRSHQSADADNRPKTTTTSTGKVITNNYDELGLLETRKIGLSSTYTITLEYYANTATMFKYKNGSDAAYVYVYDNNGNITQIRQNSAEVIGYTYDSANRLTRENNTLSNQTVTYAYDSWGNLTSKKTYDYTTGTVGTATSTLTYTYGNSAWCDQLTKLNNTTITYDNNGNPLSYRGWTFSWRGKQLITGTKGDNTITFAYDENGLRHKKVYNGVTTNYYYNGSVLIGMERSGTKYLFSYDASGNVVSVKYNGAEYYYLRNGQGDIVKLIDASGTTVVEYVYDTWGKKISTTGSMAGTLGLIQPFRYRGYVYDFEWGYYYLQSRYYDSYTGRFISSDVLLSTGQGVLGHNSYAYCLDNPVRYKDSQGREAEEAFVQPTPGPSETPYPQPGPTPPPCPEIHYERPSGYTWYESLEGAVQAWAEIYRAESELYEHCTFVYSFYDSKEKKSYYTYGETGKGSLGNETWGIRPNVVIPFIRGYFTYIAQCSKVAFVHTHPKPPDGYTVAAASKEDLFLLHLPDIHYVVVVPYENESIDYYQ